MRRINRLERDLAVRLGREPTDAIGLPLACLAELRAVSCDVVSLDPCAATRRSAICSG
ncbi:hypothetical protein AAH991_37195 [Microbispora sp. ZYX-F-249]|uniref:Uncharacterized protein n=1 Tax=Microbispora maris TaxID=3144104 RepID=A0ABV0AZW4_9ACTN